MTACYPVMISWVVVAAADSEGSWVGLYAVWAGYCALRGLRWGYGRVLVSRAPGWQCRYG